MKCVSVFPCSYSLTVPLVHFCHVHEQRFAEEMSLLSKFLGLFKKNDGFSLELVALKVQMLIVDCHSQVIRNRRFGSTTCVARSPDRNAP